jgi:glycosyltransferase involved in cell wall biosynthesis
MISHNNNWIICFGSNWYSSSVYTEKHLIKYLYKDGYSILWVNPIPIKNLNVKTSGSKMVFYKRILNRLKYQSKLFNKIDGNFWVLSPLFIPYPESSFFLAINNYLMKCQIKALKLLLKIKNEIIISSGITDVPVIFNKKEISLFIQLFGDLYSDSRDINDSTKRIIMNRERSIIDFANYILVASSRVYNKILNLNNNRNKVIYFPHGVEYNHFNNISNKAQLSFTQPIAGYFGSLTDANDKEVYLDLAKAGFSVVLIGKVTGNYSYYQHPNIHYLGPIDYSELPKYAALFDICIMAWRPAEWISNSNPCKTLEYLALGKPIVSSPIPELQNNYPDLIYFAETPLNFVECAKYALEINNAALITKRKQVAEENDWSTKYLMLKSLISNKDNL